MTHAVQQTQDLFKVLTDYVKCDIITFSFSQRLSILLHSCLLFRLLLRRWRAVNPVDAEMVPAMKQESGQPGIIISLNAKCIILTQNASILMETAPPATVI